MALPSEEWRRAPSPYRDYEISSLGRIRRGNREIVGDVDRYGYRRVQLSYAGIAKRFKVHRLVCEAFNGPCPEGLECGHLDGNSRNNAASNLQWITRGQNTLHQVAHGTFAARDALAKLTVAQVLAIREKAAAGMSERALAAEYGMSPSQIHKIKTRKAWPHV